MSLGSASSSPRSSSAAITSGSPSATTPPGTGWNGWVAIWPRRTSITGQIRLRPVAARSASTASELTVTSGAPMAAAMPWAVAMPARSPV